jgi:Rrf2 family protein
MNSDFNVAVHALVYLDHKACTLSSDALAENICTNPARVRKVMAKLKRAGLVASAEGAEGGYRLACKADRIMLDQVATAVGGQFVSTAWSSGDVSKECLVSSGMGAIMEDIYRDLDAQCRQRLAQRSIGDIGRKIFGNAHSDAETERS